MNKDEDMGFLVEEEVTEDVLSTIAKQAQLLLDMRKDIVMMEESLAMLQKEEKVLSQEDIPALLLEQGVTSITLETGEKIEVVEEVYATLVKDPFKRNKVLRWIAENGGAAMIKKELVVEEPENSILDFLNEKEIPYKTTKGVHHSTLRAWWRSKLGMAKGSLQEIELGDITKEASVFIYKKTKIK